MYLDLEEHGVKCFLFLKFRGEAVCSNPKENVAQFAQVKRVILLENTTGTSMENYLFISSDLPAQRLTKQPECSFTDRSTT